MFSQKKSSNTHADYRTFDNSQTSPRAQTATYQGGLETKAPQTTPVTPFLQAETKEQPSKREALDVIRKLSTKSYRHNDAHVAALTEPFKAAAKLGATLQELLEAGLFTETQNEVIRRLMLDLCSEKNTNQALARVAAEWEKSTASKPAKKATQVLYKPAPVARNETFDLLTAILTENSPKKP